MFDNLEYINNTLHYDGIDITTISKNFNTPVYIYSKSKIIENYSKYKNAFQRNNINNFQIAYALKANNNINILRILKNLGSSIDTVSVGEIKKALLAGFEPKKIIFSGVGKTSEELLFAIKNKIGQINIESYEEFLMICEIVKDNNIKTNISVRINPNIDAGTHEKITTGRKENKFGIEFQVAKTIMSEVLNNNEISNFITFNGFSAHIGSQILDISCFEELFKYLQKIYLEFGDNLKTIDFGGGIGIKYNENDITININDYVGMIKKYFNFFNGTIIIEPGRSIIGDAGIFLTKIIRIKKTDGNNFIIVDGGMNNLIRPAMYNAFHYPMVVRNSNNNKVKYHIVGPICESSDVFAKNFEMNKLDDNVDNYITFLCAGAYGYSMASNYNLHNIAGELLIEDEKIKVIRKEISFEDLLKFEDC